MKKILIIASFSLFIFACNHQLNSKKAQVSMRLEEQLAQKIMLDLRYYCAEPSENKITKSNIHKEEVSNSKHANTLFTNSLEGYKTDEKIDLACQTPLTKLPDELSDFISESALGGVILFADNLVNTEQIIQLTSDLQNAALNAKHSTPLFISVDQEGGRVVRLPRDITTSFTGNMAIGATYEKHGSYYAKAVGEVLGSELHALGFNVDHAPVVDVNINANNPVINVRSFGEDPKIVAKLGIAMLNGMQTKGIIGTLKHFPGHGDTNTDSHTGLPVVNHDFNTVNQVDLYPIKQAIEQADVKMIMTAHIQYPALDDSTIVSKTGEKIIKPATLSKKILTQLLRGKMSYQGLIITDALDMASIAHFFTPLDAVINTFKAGADIALMPIKIRNSHDIKKFKVFIRLLADKVKADPELLAQVETSHRTFECIHFF